MPSPISRPLKRLALVLRSEPFSSPFLKSC